jgi:DNA-binding transcriptional LysR family regulator
MPLSSNLNLSDTDLRLLRVFHAVVRNRGLAAAQTDLGITQATISNQLGHLEQRLGMRLCERGRGGFRLTEEGEVIYTASRNLFRSVENFQSVVGSVCGELIGDVHFATVDAMWSNEDLHLAEAFKKFASKAPKVLIHTDIASPQDLIKGVLEDRYHLVLVPRQNFPSQLRAVLLFEEEQGLYCSHLHELHNLPEKAVTPERLCNYPYVARSYMQDWIGPQELNFKNLAIASHMESIALLILSGKYIGYLPQHFAQRWIRRGEMRCLGKNTLTYSDSFYLVYRKREKNRSVKVLFDAISDAVSQRTA